VGELLRIMEMLVAVAGAIGFVGAVLLMVGMVWYYAAVYVVKASRETWWITAWVLHCRGSRAGAKRALRAAIETDDAR
jgi:membrane-bound ClpP family serine protease